MSNDEREIRRDESQQGEPQIEDLRARPLDEQAAEQAKGGGTATGKTSTSQTYFVVTMKDATVASVNIGGTP